MRLQKGLIMNNNSNELNRVIEKIRSSFISKDHQREIIIRQCRDIIRNSANAIRAIHRRDYDLSRQLIKNTGTIDGRSSKCYPMTETVTTDRQLPYKFSSSLRPVPEWFEEFRLGNRECD